MKLQTNFRYDQHVFEKAKLEASYAAEVHEELGIAQDLGECRELQQIDERMSKPVVSDR